MWHLDRASRSATYNSVLLLSTTFLERTLNLSTMVSGDSTRSSRSTRKKTPPRRLHHLLRRQYRFHLIHGSNHCCPQTEAFPLERHRAQSFSTQQKVICRKHAPPGLGGTDAEWTEAEFSRFPRVLSESAAGQGRRQRPAFQGAPNSTQMSHSLPRFNLFTGFPRNWFRVYFGITKNYTKHTE